MPKLNNRYISFAMILYPENEQHQRILAMFERREMLYKPVYILHYRDVWTDVDELPDGVNVGDRKKPHWHVAVTRTQQTTAEAFSKFLGGIYVEGLHDKPSYIQYMLHDTPSSWHKVPYDVSELHGYALDIKRFISKNANFVQLRGYADLVARGDSIVDIVRGVSENEFSAFTELYKTYGGLMMAMANQFDRRSVVKSPRTKEEAEMKKKSIVACQDIRYYTPSDIQYMRQVVSDYELEYGD